MVLTERHGQVLSCGSTGKELLPEDPNKLIFSKPVSEPLPVLFGEYCVISPRLYISRVLSTGDASLVAAVHQPRYTTDIQAVYVTLVVLLFR
jgi:hypothetical protein